MSLGFNMHPLGYQYFSVTTPVAEVVRSLWSVLDALTAPVKKRGVDRLGFTNLAWKRQVVSSEWTGCIRECVACSRWRPRQGSLLGWTVVLYCLGWESGHGTRHTASCQVEFARGFERRGVSHPG